MKKFILAACLASLSSVASADDAGPGCGVGSIIFEGESGVGPNILAATTNQFVGQTYSMTSNTLGCDTTIPIGSNPAVAIYLDENLDSVAQDMARGEGEALVSLAQVIGISPAEQPEFFSTVQSQFDTIFAGEQVTRGSVMQNLYAVLEKNENLSKYVTNA